jgi:hypothetical protein
MRPRNLFIIVVAGVLLTSLLSQPVWAKSPQRYRWEGVAIGLGAALLGSAILHDSRNSRYARNYSRPQHQPRYNRHYQKPRHRPRHYKRYGYRPCDYYDYERFWVPPVYNHFWRPGRYDPYERGVRGRWKKRMNRPGHWEERRYCRSDR